VLRSKRAVLEDISFTAQPGAITAVLGAAGAGKTSLLSAIAGLIKLERGAILCRGTDVTKTAVAKRGISLLPPGTMLAPGTTVQAVLRRIAGRGRASQVDALADQLGLTALLDRDAGTLSHGEAQLALTAARLAQLADAILVDEAASGLDDEAASRLQAALRAQAEASRVILLATRTPAIARLADHLVLLGGGRVLQSGTPASLYAEPRDAACAHLTGYSNIISGQIREIRPGGFIWSAGARFVQATTPDLVRPALGTAVSFCLRPERVALLGPNGRADNEIDVTITDLRSAGPLLLATLAHPKFTLTAAIPSWSPAPYPAIGQQVRAGWSANAAHPLIVR
jgi:ABC-type Fe3+/spermidine/putrescine transport system ATPase subunit